MSNRSGHATLDGKCFLVVGWTIRTRTISLKRKCFCQRQNISQFDIMALKTSVIKTAEIVARQMEIDINKITLDIYEQGIQEFSSNFGHKMWTQVDNESDESFCWLISRQK